MKKSELKQQLVKILKQKKISQNDLAVMLDISPAALSHILNDQWEKISKESFVNLYSQVMPDMWRTVRTANFQSIQIFCDKTRNRCKMSGIIGYTGAGKTTALKAYNMKNANTYLVTCKKSMSTKQFFIEILRVMGIKFNGSIYDIIQTISRELNRKQSPLLIIDEAGKLSITQLLYMHDLRDSTQKNAGIVLSGVDYFKANLLKAVEKSKEGMPELYDRISLWLPLHKPTRREIKSICQLNGLVEPDKIRTAQKLRNYRKLYNYVESEILKQELVYNEEEVEA